MKSLSDAPLSQILSHIRSVRERDMVVSLLVESLERIPSKTVIAQALVAEGVQLEAPLSAFFSDHPTEATIQKGIEDLEGIPVVRLTIAFSPSGEALTRWHGLVAKALSAPCVLDITKDEEVAGGAVVDMKGKIFRSVMADGMEE